MKEFIEQFKAALTGSDYKKRFNQMLVDKVFADYKKRFKEESMTNTMVFPTCFRIFLHPEDFKDRESEAFRAMSREMANEFCIFNRKKMQYYKYNQTDSKFWLFQFAEFKEGLLVGDAKGVKKGELLIDSSLRSEDFSENNDNISNEKGRKLTKVTKGKKNPQEIRNVNYEAFRDIKQLRDNRFLIKINKNYEDIPDEDRSQIRNNEIIATLVCDKKFISGSQIFSQYKITDNFVVISGKNDERKGSVFIKIDSNSLPNDIVHIKCENNKFQLAAFGKVRLNGMLVRESKGGDVQWEPLSDISTMLIEDKVSIEFKRIK